MSHAVLTVAKWKYMAYNTEGKIMNYRRENAFLKRFYLFIHERHRERERQGHRQREKQAPRGEPDAGLDLRTSDHDLSQSQTLKLEALRCPLECVNAFIFTHLFCN